MPRLPGMKAVPWFRVVWIAQIVLAGFRALEAHEREQARTLLSKLARERRLSKRDREHLRKLATKAGRGAASGARGRRGRRR